MNWEKGIAFALAAHILACFFQSVNIISYCHILIKTTDAIATHVVANADAVKIISG